MERSDLSLNAESSPGPARSASCGLAPGDLLVGRYHVAQLVQEGGMSQIFLAWDRSQDRYVAVKALKSAWLSEGDVALFARQFQQEGQMVASLCHPALPRIIHYLQEGRGSYLVMDFIHGESLDRVIHRYARPLPEPLVLTWAHEMAQALRYLHGLPNPIIVRDLKPSNVMLMPSGHLKLIDFGISKVCDSPAAQTRTVIRGSGTPGYAPPEQYGTQGSRRTDARSDLYALGATLFSLLTGMIPPDAMERVLNNVDTVSPRAVNAAVSTPMDALVTWLLRLRPEDRPASADVVLESLACMGAAAAHPPMPPDLRIEPMALPAMPRRDQPPTQLRPPAPPPPPPPRRRRSGPPVAAMLGGILLILALFMGAVHVFQGGTVTRAETSPSPSPSPSPPPPPTPPPPTPPSPSPPPPRSAALEIVTRPAGARVTLLHASADPRELADRTPVTVRGLQPGTYRVVIEKGGYVPRTFPLELEGGQIVSKEVVLVAEPRPPRPAPPRPAPPRPRPPGVRPTVSVERIRFAPGAVSATAYRSLGGGARAFLLGIGAGQVMTVRVSASGRVVNVYRKSDMAWVRPTYADGRVWRGRLPQTTDYVVLVSGGTVSVTFYIPP